MSSQTQDAKQLTAPDIRALKGVRKLCMMTAYDYPTARLVDQSGMDMILVGDSLAMVVLGYEDTLSLTMEEMLHHTRAAARGTRHALLVSDMPFLSYQVSMEQAVRNAGRFLSEGRAKAVKVEGGRDFAPHIKAMVRAGIPVMGHLGLTPQYMATLGGFKAQGRSSEAVLCLLDDAKALEDAGVFSIVLEAIPNEAAALITDAVSVPTIGIGAGNMTDGQVLVLHDMLGLFDRFVPRFVKQYAQMGSQIVKAMGKYVEDVRSGAFPAEEHSLHLSKEECAKLK
ncbi:MAG: 3-methyl-2-oxobutanoate hydroxymethyltransferase [Desulfovibrionaceae bacterium]